VAIVGDVVVVDAVSAAVVVMFRSELVVGLRVVVVSAASVPGLQATSTKTVARSVRRI